MFDEALASSAAYGIAAHNAALIFRDALAEAKRSAQVSANAVKANQRRRGTQVKLIDWIKYDQLRRTNPRLSQEALATRLGVSRPTLRKWLNDRPEK